MSRPFPGEEPPAGDRGLARAARSQFVALLQAGFTEQQALTLVGQMLAVVLAAQMGRSQDGI